MDQLSQFVLIAGMATVTYAGRIILFVLTGQRDLPQRVKDLLSYVPPVVLSVIIFPMVLLPDGNTLDLGIRNAHLIGAITAVIVSMKYKNVMLTVVVALGVFFFWRYVIL